MPRVLPGVSVGISVETWVNRVFDCLTNLWSERNVIWIQKGVAGTRSAFPHKSRQSSHRGLIQFIRIGNFP